MTPYVLGGIALLGLLLIALGAPIVNAARSPDGAGAGLFIVLVGIAVWLLDLLALLLWLWLG